MTMQQAPRDEWITIDGLSFHYRDWGGTGHPLVLLHGLASPCHIWDLVAPIMASDFSVIAMDQRGHGDSAKPEYGYDFATVCQDVAGFIEAKSLEKPIVVGHSWGGDVALELGVASPGLAKGLCFIDGGMIEPSARYQSLDDAREQMAPPVFNGVTPESLLERVRSRSDSLGPAFENMVMANFETLQDGTIRAKLSRANHIRIIEALWDHHPPALYPKVSCPVLVLPARQQADEADAQRNLLRTDTVSAAGDLLPKSRTEWLEDSIHDVPVQRPELVSEVIKRHVAEGFFD